jgi:hypothetical protein
MYYLAGRIASAQHIAQADAGDSKTALKGLACFAVLFTIFVGVAIWRSRK